MAEDKSAPEKAETETTAAETEAAKAETPAKSEPEAEATTETAKAEKPAKSEPKPEAAAETTEAESGPAKAKKPAKSEPKAEATPDSPSAPPSSPEPAPAASDAVATVEAVADAPVTETPAVAAEPVILEPVIDAQGRAYATGKRKNAVARVWIMPGAGQLTVNGRDGDSYFARPVLRMIINQPLAAVDRASQYDVWCTVTGGGLSGQAGAVRHGIAKALTSYEPGLRPRLKGGGFLTRDSRVVERKKYGKRKARRSFQFSKR